MKNKNESKNETRLRETREREREREKARGCVNLFEINSRSSGKTGETAIYSSCIDSGAARYRFDRKFQCG